MDKLIETININQIPFEDIERKMGVPPSAFLNAPDSEDIIDALTTLTTTWDSDMRDSVCMQKTEDIASESIRSVTRKSS